MIRKVLPVSMILVFALNFTMMLPALSSPEQRIYVDPADNSFSTDTTSVGDTFTISVMAGDWEEPGLWGYQFQLLYDNTMLEATAAEMPDDHFFTPETTPGIFIVDPGTIDHDEGFVSFSLSCLTPEPGKTGSGVIATITFQITAAPPTGGRLTSSLDLDEVILVDTAATEIPADQYVIEDGAYEFTTPGIQIDVYLKVTPASSSARELGDVVTIAVTIHEADAALRLVNVAFQLQYDATLLEPDVVTEGTFLSTFGTTLFNTTIEANYVAVNLTLQTGDTGPFPDGSGTLVTIEFNAIFIPDTLTTADLTLDEVTLTDVDGTVIEYDHLEHGTYQVPLLAEPEDINQDGDINIEDIAVWALYFGSYPGHERWDARADINGDEMVNVIDAILICQKFR